MSEASHPAPAPSSSSVDAGPRTGAATCYELLDVAEDAPMVEVRKAYERALALLDGRAIGGYLVLAPEAAKSVRADLEDAWRRLGDVERRAAYDRQLASGRATRSARTSPPVRILAPVDTTGGKAGEATTTASRAPSSATRDAPVTTSNGASTARTSGAPPAAGEVPSSRKSVIRFATPTDEISEPARPAPSHLAAATTIPQPAPFIPAHDPETPSSPGTPIEGPVDGDAVRRLRESRGLSLAQVADATKLRPSIVRAIEAADVDNLPDRVYLRGFLTQIARVLKTDRKRLADEYIAFIARKRGE